MSDDGPEWTRTRWLHIVAPDGSLWMETSSPSEIRDEVAKHPDWPPQRLYAVWCSALDASAADDQQEDIHECPACGDPHSHLDEAKYVVMQRAKLMMRRAELDAVLRSESTK